MNIMDTLNKTLLRMKYSMAHAGFTMLDSSGYVKSEFEELVKQPQVKLNSFTIFAEIIVF